MKRLIFFVLAAFAFAACEQAPIEEQLAVRQDAPETITVGFEGDDTRIQLNEAQKTVWTKGDQVSVFYKSYDNLKFEFEGNTGDRNGTLKRVGGQHNGQTMDDVVVVYPYSADYMITLSDGCVNATIPSTQTYLKGSYGVGDNLMIARSSFNQFSLKSVCGWLKIQLTGAGEIIERITFRGNDGEQVAGLVYVDATTAEATLATAKHNSNDNSQLDGTLVLDDSIYTEVTLDCGEGVALGKEATAFYIALPPQTFEQGFTVEIEDTEGYVMGQSTDKALTIERNHIQPMAALEFINPNPPTQPTPASNQIWYTSSDGNVVKPCKTNVFGATIISNEYNNGMGVITFDCDVTSIGDWAFYNCYSLTSVNIPDSVTTIGNYAFAYCSSLTSVNIPDSVTTIGNGAFACCDSLQEFKGKFATEDGRCLIIDGILNSFAPDSLTEYTIPDSVTTIGNYAFYYCESLTSVNIPDSVTLIGSYAFYYCDSLTSVNIPDSVTTIGMSAFEGCDSLTSVTIGDSVKTIGYETFYKCTSLTSVYCKATAPPALSGIFVFDNNGSGRKIYVPTESVEAYKSATNWSEYADAIVGYDFENGEIVEVQPNNEIWYTSYDGNIVEPYNTNVFGATIISNEYNNGMGVITFDDSVTTIGNYAFKDCESLTSVTIPDSVTKIGNDAFYGCENLTSVNFPDSVTSIGERAFSNCDSLTEFKGKFASEDGRCLIIDGILNSFAIGCGVTEYTIPDSVTTIGNYAFEDCDSLTSVTIPDSVTTIGGYAFYHCNSLTSVTIPDSVTTIGGYAFSYCDSLTSVTIPDSITSIGKGAFSNCNSLTSVNIPDSVTSIGEGAFSSCYSLTSVTIPDSVTTIGETAFFHCSSLTSVTIGDSVTSIGNSAFWCCYRLTSVNIPDSVTTIGGYAFYHCDSLTSVTIPDSVTTIGNCAFNSCTNLQEFKGKFASEDGRCLIIDGVLNSFAIGCGVTEYTIPDSVTTIGDSAFSFCDSLTSVNIGNSVTTIGSSAFCYCGSLTSVYCKATTPPSLDGTYVFDNNGSGRKIYVPAESVSAYKSATYWREYADSIVGYDFDNGVVVE